MLRPRRPDCAAHAALQTRDRSKLRSLGALSLWRSRTSSAPLRALASGDREKARVRARAAPHPGHGRLASHSHLLSAGTDDLPGWGEGAGRLRRAAVHQAHDIDLKVHSRSRASPSGRSVRPCSAARARSACTCCGEPVARRSVMPYRPGSVRCTVSCPLGRIFCGAPSRADASATSTKSETSSQPRRKSPAGVIRFNPS